MTLGLSGRSLQQQHSYMHVQEASPVNLTSKKDIREEKLVDFNYSTCETSLKNQTIVSSNRLYQLDVANLVYMREKDKCEN